MMRNLNNGVYDNLQRRHAYHVWAFQSGHWDLRDQTIERYCRNVKNLMRAMDSFRMRHPGMKLVWSGVPPYSYKVTKWGALERRTNLKLLLGDQCVQQWAASFNIRSVSFMDIALPFYRESCDTHHYFCPHSNRSKHTSTIGIAHALIHRIAIEDTILGEEVQASGARGKTKDSAKGSKPLLE